MGQCEAERRCSISRNVVVVFGKYTRVGMVRCYIGRICVDRHWVGENHLLPAGGGFAAEGGGGQQGAARAPQVADVRAGVIHAFVEADAGNESIDVSSELHTDFH